MTEDEGALLKAEWDKHQDWGKLGDFVTKRRAISYQAGFREGQKAIGIVALDGLLKVLRS